MKACVKLAAFVLFVLLAAGSLFAQDDAATAGRKLVKSPKPVYPALARPLNLSGTVRLEVTVAPNGSVKALDVKGGNPLLVQSAQFTVREWKWEKAEHETTQILEVHFTP